MTNLSCASCNAPLEEGAKFCESCGSPVAGTTPVDPVAQAAERAGAGADDWGSGPISRPTHRTPRTPGAAAPGASGPSSPDGVLRGCLTCGGEVGPDGYCETCGAKAPSERDHFRETPAAWVAGVCDRGIRHAINEDAMALLATPASGQRAVLVVLDGVSNTDDSHVASLAGARAAREVLRTRLPQGMGTASSRTAAVTKVFADTVLAANQAVVATTPEGSVNPPSATFVTAVIEGSRLAFANVGDSRAYWLPDGGAGVQLSVDDSAAEEQIAAGVPRVEAESGPLAHSITKWLGRDAHDLTPRVGELEISEPGWVLVCSDGLWNYASESQQLMAQIQASGASDPLELALALVKFANDSGGQDNITAALARIEPTVAAAPAPAPPAPAPTTPPAAEQGETHG